MNKKLITILFLIASSILLIFLYLSSTHKYLRFSDGAKYADIASNLINGQGYRKGFNFFSKRGITWPHDKLFEARSFPPIAPYSMALVFRVFGTSDFSVILTSSFYFVGIVIMTYLLGKYLFDNSVGIISSLAVASNINLLDYATSGASETTFIFLILLAVYLVMLKKRYSELVAFGVMILLYLTRPQAVIYILGIIFLVMLKRFGYKRGFVFIAAISLITLIIDRLIIYPLSIYYNIMPLYERGTQAIEAHLLGSSPSEAIRGAGVKASGFFVIFKKLFYNLFNFYRRLPDIMSPYLFFAFVLGLFVKNKNKITEKAKFAVFVVVSFTFVAAALTIPFFRYIHPIVPLVYIFGVGAIFMIAEKLKFSDVIPAFLVFVFVIILSITTMLVDARFNRTIYNFDKPPIYVLLSEKLKLHTEHDDVIVTNLDTWGTWYGDRKTIWLPLKPEQLIPSKGDLTIDAVYITNYLIDDENYYLGDKWREILNDPVKINESVHGIEFEGYEVIEISQEETFENIPAEGVIIWRKDGRV